MKTGAIVAILLACLFISSVSGRIIELMGEGFIPEPNEEITVYVQTDTPLFAMGLGIEVLGDANITGAMCEADCNQYGWDNGWSSDPYIDPNGWVYINGVSWAGEANGVVGYIRFRYNSGQVTVSIFESETLDANGQSVEFSDRMLIFGQPDSNDPNDPNDPNNPDEEENTSAAPYWYPDLAGKDNFVNFADFAVFAQNWQKSGSKLAGDFDNSGVVNIDDLAYFTYYWLQEIHFQYVPRQILVGFKPEVTQGTVEALAESLNCSIIRKLRKRNVYLWNVKGINNEQQVINQLQTNPDVLYAERNGIAYPNGQKIPNDSSFNLQWNLHQTSNADINAPEGWYEIYNKFGRIGDPNIIIAIVDTGVDYNHPDLSASMWTDSNGHHGYDFVNGDNYPMDDDGHGTHVAGIAAAVTNNSIGVAGVSWGCSIMAVKVLPAVGGGSYSDIADGVDYAVDNGVRVISMSLGGSINSLALKNAINSAYDANVVIVAAAGNSADDLDVNSYYPACYDNVICVSATNSDDQYANFTNYGSYIDVAAPGEDIYSTLRNNTYGYMSGTSMAAPHVSGLAALCLSMYSGSEPNEVKQCIIDAVDDLGSAGKDDYYGYGRITIPYNCCKCGFGTGTSTDPYRIRDFNDLCQMLTVSNRLTAYWKLCADIDASASSSLDGGAGWTPVGKFFGVPFTGGFDGDGFTITGIFINRPALHDGVGFFGIVNNASTVITNIRLIDVDITGYDSVGSLCGGFLAGSASKCCTTGSIISVGIAQHADVGGFCAFAVSGTTIDNCYSSCSVTRATPCIEDFIGGFCGYLGTATSLISNCYSTGLVLSTSGNTGGFCGGNGAEGQGEIFVPGTITHCYYDSETSGQSDTGKGEPRTTVQMKQQATFAGWDFNNVWDINEGISYPFLR